MARLRSPEGCPWDREQDHLTLRWHAVEEVYELLDAIEAGDDHELEEELGDLLLQVVFHCQLARERGAFDFEKVARHISDKLIRRHPHVFGNAPRQGRGPGLGELGEDQARREARDPARAALRPGRHPETPARAAAGREAGEEGAQSQVAGRGSRKPARTKRELAERLFALAQFAQEQGWSAEELLRGEIKRRERALRAKEAHQRTEG